MSIGRIYSALVIAALLATILPAAPAVAQTDVSIRMALDRSRIGSNETAVLTVAISAAGQKQLPEPKLPPLPQFDIMTAGSSTNLQIINGQVSYSQNYTYILTPKQVGTFPIYAASAVVNGTRYESNTLSLEVVKGSAGSQTIPGGAAESGVSSKDLFLRAEVDKRNPYVDEQVTLSVKFFRAIKLLSNPDYVPPQTPGFWTSDIPPQKQYYQTIDGRDYFVVEVRTALFPTAPGKLTIGEARVTAAVPDRSRRRNRDAFGLFDDMFQQGTNVEVTSSPVTVDVRPLPAEGKPAEFSGGVGDYKISAAIDKNDVEVNEAVNLSVKVTGQGNIKSIPEPTLPVLDGFRVEKGASDFKISNLDNQMGGVKSFEYVLIPRQSGRQTIGPITLNYFDPSKRAYQSLNTAPMTLSVRQGELTTGAEIPYNPVSGQTLDLKATDIRFIKTGGTHLYRKGRVLLTSPLFITFLTLPLLAIAGGMIDVRRRRRLSEDVGYARLRRANAVAKKRLKKAAELLAGNDDAAFYAEISGMVLQYIADKFNQSAQGLTTDRVDELLKEASAPDSLREDTLNVVRLADFGRFAGGAGAEVTKEMLFEKVRNVIIGLEETL
ncbi:MAG: BatD family protein [candidate division Zixibacteria bacterium]|nr:BatD family protein [candidate division Zixibacteria bacterium]